MSSGLLGGSVTLRKFAGHRTSPPVLIPLERLQEAFLHERSIPQETYRAQELKTKEALTLAKMELDDGKATECDVE